MQTGARGVSLVLGAGVGGFLACPVRQYPGVFSATGLFARYSPLDWFVANAMLSKWPVRIDAGCVLAGRSCFFIQTSNTYESTTTLPVFIVVAG